MAFPTPRFFALLLLCVTACECEPELRVESATPWIRCSEWPVVHGDVAGVGRLEERRISLEARRLEVFALGAESLPWLEANAGTCGDQCIQVVLGGVTRAAGLAQALAARGRALVLAGGEDSTAELDLDEFEGLLDLRGVRIVELAGVAFVPLAGAPEGTLGRGDDACGYDAADLQSLEVPEGGWVLSWMAPEGQGGDPIDRGLLGAHVGDSALQTWMGSQPLAGSLHAYPREAAGRSSGGDVPRFVVPVAGALQVRADGSRVVGEPIVLVFDHGWQVER